MKCKCGKYFSWFALDQVFPSTSGNWNCSFDLERNIIVERELRKTKLVCFNTKRSKLVAIGSANVFTEGISESQFSEMLRLSNPVEFTILFKGFFWKTISIELHLWRDKQTDFMKELKTRCYLYSEYSFRPLEKKIDNKINKIYFAFLSRRRYLFKICSNKTRQDNTRSLPLILLLRLVISRPVVSSVSTIWPVWEIVVPEVWES